MGSRGCTAVLELLATPARAIIIAADPGCRARCRGLPGGAAQEKVDVREIFGLVRFYTDDYLPVVSFTKRDDLFAFGIVRTRTTAGRLSDPNFAIPDSPCSYRIPAYRLALRLPNLLVSRGVPEPT